MYSVAPENFSVTTKGYFVDFIFYSFYGIFNNSVNIITPDSALARFILMGEGFLGLVLLVLLVSIFFTTQSERYKEELDDAIEIVKEQGTKLEHKITIEFSMTLEQAEESLEKAENSIAEVVTYLSSRIQR